MKGSEATRILKCHITTLYNYTKPLEKPDGTVRPPLVRLSKLPNGRNDYNDDDVYALTGKSAETAAVPDRWHVVYARCGPRILESGETGRGGGMQHTLSQAREVKAWAESKGYCISRIYRDASGAGAYARDARKAFNSLMHDIKDGKVQTVFVYSPDRISLYDWRFFEEMSAMFDCRVQYMTLVISKSPFVREYVRDMDHYGGRIVRAIKRGTPLSVVFEQSYENACKIDELVSGKFRAKSGTLGKPKKNAYVKGESNVDRAAKKKGVDKDDEG